MSIPIPRRDDTPLRLRIMEKVPIKFLIRTPVTDRVVGNNMEDLLEDLCIRLRARIPQTRERVRERISNKTTLRRLRVKGVRHAYYFGVRGHCLRVLGREETKVFAE